MLKRNTLLVVGAGASKEFGLPIGADLNTLIKQRLRFFEQNRQVYEQNRALLNQFMILGAKLKGNKSHFVDLAEVVKEGLTHAKSIDNFIRTHNSNQSLVLVCKMLIADVIAQAERNSSLMPNGKYKPYSITLGRRPETWLDVFARNLFADLSLDELPNQFSKLRIVCFNYDRCIEVYLQRAIQSYFLIDKEQSCALVDRIKIIHPYGSLGSLWGEESSIDFAHEGASFNTELSASQIRTFHEGVSQPAIGDEVRKSVAWSNAMVFLGFGFLQQNVELMKPNTHDLAGKRAVKVFATVKDLSPENIVEVNYQINAMLFDGERALASVLPMDSARTCASLLEAHRGELFGF